MAIITISRGTFTGGRQLAECISEKLGYRLVSGEMILEAASQYGAPVEKLSRAISRGPGIIDRITVERDRYLTFIKAALLKEAQGDSLVYHGHAGHLLLEGIPHVIKVRIIASIEVRVKAIMDQHNICRDEALKIIKRVDSERIKWTRFFYHINWSDPAIYDLVVNLDRVNLDSACEVVSVLSRQETFRSTPISKKIVDDLVLSSNVMAILAKDINIVTSGIDVRADGGVVTIEGSTQWGNNRAHIESTVSSVPGVDKVIDKVGISPSWSDDEALKIN